MSKGCAVARGRCGAGRPRGLEVRCGTCKGRHEHVDDVRACAGLPPRSVQRAGRPTEFGVTPHAPSSGLSASIAAEIAPGARGDTAGSATDRPVRSPTSSQSHRSPHPTRRLIADELDEGVVYITSSASSEVYHRLRECRSLGRGIEYVASRGVLPTEVSEVPRSHAQRHGRRPCRSCCPKAWEW
jgi:hypothetical protein